MLFSVLSIMCAGQGWGAGVREAQGRIAYSCVWTDQAGLLSAEILPVCISLDAPHAAVYICLLTTKTEKEQPLPQFVLSPFTKQTACAPKSRCFQTGVLCHSSATMIRKNVLACKLILIKSSAASLYQSQKADFRPELETCPYCGSRGCCVPFASYERYVIDFLNSRPVCETVRVPRVKCGSCGRTHAILTDSLIPYRSYSLFFILRVIGEYLLRLRTVENLCGCFGITHSMLYRWIRLYREHKAEWLGLLSDLEQEPLAFLRKLASLPAYCSFSDGFYRRTLMSFLQSHANPANCRFQPGRHP